MGRKVLVMVMLMAVLLGACPQAALAHESEGKAGPNPLEIVAHVLYPIGWFLENFLFKPLHGYVHTEPAKSVHGHEQLERED